MLFFALAGQGCAFVFDPNIQGDDDDITADDDDTTADDDDTTADDDDTTADDDDAANDDDDTATDDDDTAVDADGDGSSAAEDCDDTDPLVHPGASEDCGDLLDTDCDGQSDQTDTDCLPLVQSIEGWDAQDTALGTSTPILDLEGLTAALPAAQRATHRFADAWRLTGQRLDLTVAVELRDPQSGATVFDLNNGLYLEAGGNAMERILRLPSGLFAGGLTLVLLSSGGGEALAQTFILQGEPAFACWDANQNRILDGGEDINGDGTGDVMDCRGADGADGGDGVSCWDANQNTLCDGTEGDGDGVPGCTVADCQPPAETWATESWVQDTALDGYATETWVQDPALSDVALQSWVDGEGFMYSSDIELWNYHGSSPVVLTIDVSDPDDEVALPVSVVGCRYVMFFMRTTFDYNGSDSSVVAGRMHLDQPTASAGDAYLYVKDHEDVELGTASEYVFLSRDDPTDITPTLGLDWSGSGNVPGTISVEARVLGCIR